MKRLIGPAIVLAASALLVHISALLLLPHYVMSQVLGRALDAGALNAIVHAPRVDAEARAIVRPSPDLYYSLCAFDLAAGPLEVQAPVPQATYWSVSIYADNTDNFFVVNDLQTGLDSVDFLLVPAGTRVKTDLPVIQSPSRRGVVLFRTFIAGEERAGELDTARRAARCATYAPDPAPAPADPLPEGAGG